MSSLKSILLFFLTIFFFKISAQELPKNTTWEGKLMGIRLVLKVSQDSLTRQQKATYDSPDQGGFDLAVSELKISEDSLEAYSAVIGGGFSGKFNSDKSAIEGAWTQRGNRIPLILTRVKNIEPQVLIRPQMPKAPFPYKEEKLIYFNTDKSIKFGATLTLPLSNKSVPVAILITGSGQEDRDESLFGHKLFWVIADHLSRNGIAVLRVDDRGIGETTGDVYSATSADFAKDVLAGIDYLKTRKELNHEKIGLIGHSEGGMIAPLVANQSSDVAFIVSLAGLGIKGSELLKKQLEDSYINQGFDKESISNLNQLTDILIQLNEDHSNIDEIKKAFPAAFEKWRSAQSDDLLLKSQLKGEGSDKNIAALASRMFMPWMRYFIKYDPSTTLTKLKMPVLAMNGEKDVQVSAPENLAGFQKYLTQAGNKDFKIVSFPGLNHMFQTADTGSPAEYVTIEETIAPEALKVMTDWIKERVSNRQR
jgi:pimeloyl-ACP methyl ester carboxylesterase